jgi:predicted anti-sigma-YlaC factor YlaD
VNCHPAEKLLSAERDQTLGADARAELEAHLAECAACRKLRTVLAESATAWRVNTAEARAPDERVEWQRIRRRLNGAAMDESRRPGWNVFAVWRGVALAGAAAAMLLGFVFGPGLAEQSRGASAAIAATDTVEVAGDATSAVVFVDQKSGWLVVWAAAPADGG